MLRVVWYNKYMRTADDYKKLVEGYGFVLSLLKKGEPKLYDKIIEAKNLLNQNGVQFAEMVRDLRVDFVNENDNKQDDEIGVKAISIDKGFNKESFALTYLPDYEYALIFVYIKTSIFGTKKIFCQFRPTVLDEINEDTIVDIFRISTLDNNDQVKKRYNYSVSVEGGELILSKQDEKKPNANEYEIKIINEEIEGVQDEISKMF